ncbi:MAG: adenylate/guanylate cyclase domain-containing protein [Gammaproteobacteria bacterium]
MTSAKSVECAVLFADVADSTGLYARHGAARARDVLSRGLSAMAAVCRRHGGVVVKTIGDEIMCRFARSLEAVHAACGIQEALTQRFDGIALAVHIGLHRGTAFVDENDVYGDVANVAAVMTTIAKAGQIITTQNAVDDLPPETIALTRLYDIITLKGDRREISIYEVLWKQDEITSILTHADLQAQAITRIHLSYKTRQLTILPDTAGVRMGRESGCDLVVDANLVSRIHASIAYRRGKFVLVDQSTNGTFVRHIDGQEVYLRREEMPLWGRGSISLGRTARRDEQELIHYSAEQ